MSKPAPRSLLKQIIFHFVNAMKPRHVHGTEVGKDPWGTRYFETPLNKDSTKIRASRYYVTAEKDDFELEVPPEWMAWLRYRRKEPPTEEEVIKNYNAMLQVQENARRLEEERIKKLKQKLGDNLVLAEKKETIKSFPSYGDKYESYGGADVKRK